MFCIKLYILVEDYDEALEIVTDYLKSKISKLNKESEDKKYKETLKKLASIAAAPYCIDKDEEFCGIAIMKKEKDL
ncbi:MAG: hypothetical protein KBT21_04045 [Treponema sp.]|nr:hypothetical protein [Candidatus Treponema merdequi]